jgi:hypothetical protein
LHGHYRIAFLVTDDGNVGIPGMFHGTLDVGRYLS